MSNQYSIFKDRITCEEVLALSQSPGKIEIPQEVESRVESCRNYLDNRIKEGGKPIYGVNTGFGSLCNTVIGNDQLEDLQKNLVLSHACGMGDEVPEEIRRMILLLKVRGLSYGKSGIALDTIKRLLFHVEKDALPVIYQLGSLGASGDLAPLAHMSLPLMGEGQLDVNGKRVSSNNWLKEQGLEALSLKAKEGLALLNGTQFMSAYGTWCVTQAQKLYDWSILIAALSLDAYDGRTDAFHPGVHEARYHPGQAKVAAELLKTLEGSEQAQSEKAHVQDPYSFRCLPQVLGASYDALDYVRSVVEREISAVTDNPMVLYEESEVISAGNFHGQPLALALDFLAISAAEVGSISERRTYKLISGTRGLPAFLTSNPGVNSGLMIPQYTAASMVSQNKQLCSPASVDSIDSSNGQEDHVSMGANAATKAYRVIQNLKGILAIELFNASRAFALRPLSTSPKIQRMLDEYAKVIQYDGNDCFLQPMLKRTEQFIDDHMSTDFNA